MAISNFILSLHSSCWMQQVGWQCRWDRSLSATQVAAGEV